jgi:hypothetical protein
MRARLTIVFLLVVTTAAWPANAEAPKLPFAPMDVFELQWADNPVLSPDGSGWSTSAASSTR